MLYNLLVLLLSAVQLVLLVHRKLFERYREFVRV